MNREDEILFRVSLGRYDNKYSGRYNGIPLPNEAIELEELKAAADHIEKLREEGVKGQEFKRRNKDVLFPKLVTSASPEYIRIDLSTNNSRHDLHMKENQSELSDFCMSIPKPLLNWEKSPLEGSGSGDEVIVEINYEGNEHGADSNHLRLYTPEDYFPNRYCEWDDRNITPRNLSVGAGFVSGRDGLSSDQSQQETGQKVRVIVYDARHPKVNNPENENSPPDPQELQALADAGELPRRQAHKLKVQWDPLGGRRGFPSRAKTVHEEKYCTETEVDIPEEGYLQFTVKSERGEGKTWISRFSFDSLYEPVEGERVVGDGWHGVTHTNPQDSDHLNVFIDG